MQKGCTEKLLKAPWGPCVPKKKMAFFFESGKGTTLMAGGSEASIREGRAVETEIDIL